jgi:hypothetical protein
MFLTITSILLFLVFVNFLLLFLSCNKTPKTSVVDQTEKVPMYRATRNLNHGKEIELAPTGS